MLTNFDVLVAAFNMLTNNRPWGFVNMLTNNRPWGFVNMLTSLGLLCDIPYQINKPLTPPPTYIGGGVSMA